MCILSPVLLIFLFSFDGKAAGLPKISEDLAFTAGIIALLGMVAAAVAIFLHCSGKTERFEYLEQEPVELAYGVTGVVGKRKKGYEPSHGFFLITGIVLCILSAIPLFVCSVLGLGGILSGACGFLLCLLFVAAGVFFLVRTCVIFGSFQKLLEEGDYTREKKAAEKRNEAVTTVYWCAVTAVYLGWSFYTMKWERTWIIWPCAAVLFGAILAVSNAVRKK